jgi:hypothetical protein
MMFGIIPEAFLERVVLAVGLVPVPAIDLVDARSIWRQRAHFTIAVAKPPRFDANRRALKSPRGPEGLTLGTVSVNLR